MEEVVNPAVPTTTGALLAEEWTINPMTPLPSFMEMFMMDEAARSAQHSLHTGLGILQRRLESRAAQYVDVPGVVGGGSANTISLSRIRALLQRASSKISSNLARILQIFGPEISCLILYAMERHCLRSDACATISESLYGGRQAKVERIKNGTSNSANNNNQRKLMPLSDRDKTRLALLVSLGPYLRHRMLLWYQQLKRQPPTITAAVSSTTFITMLQRVRKLFVWAYPLLHVSLSSLDLVYQWRYLLGHSVFFHPYSQYLGFVVRRVTQEDSRGGSSESNYAKDVKSTNTLGELGPPSSSAEAPPSPLRKAAVLAVSSAVVLSWISHFRSEYQQRRQEQIMIQQQQQRQDSTPHASSGIGHNSFNSSIASHIPPPPSSGVAKHALPPHLCPLCRHPRVNPTASPSGFVFCYKCLLDHVRAHGKCPITERACTEDQLLRLYEPNAPNTSTSVPESGAG